MQTNIDDPTKWDVMVNGEPVLTGQTYMAASKLVVSLEAAAPDDFAASTVTPQTTAV